MEVYLSRFTDIAYLLYMFIDKIQIYFDLNAGLPCIKTIEVIHLQAIRRRGRLHQVSHQGKTVYKIRYAESVATY